MMAKASYTKRGGIFGSVGDFDIDEDGEYCGVIGGEMADRKSVGPVWDWRPDEGTDKPARSDARVLGQLDHSEFHTAREGSHRHGDREMGGQMNPVDRGTIELFRGGPGNPGHDGSEIHDGFEENGPASGGVDPVRAGSRQHGGARNLGGQTDPVRRGSDDSGMRTRGGQVDPVRRGTRR